MNNAVAGSNPSGNVILGTGSAGAVQDTDAQDPSNALTVVAVHTGPEGASTGTGTVGQASDRKSRHPACSTATAPTPTR